MSERHQWWEFRSSDDKLANRDKELRELVAKWDREADAYGTYTMKEQKRWCARELEALLTQQEKEQP